MSQCVPSWGLNGNPNNPKLPYPTHTNSLSSAHNVPILDYEVAELTWENGQLSMHGLGQPRVPNKLQSTASTAKYTWEKPRAGETLEAIVNQAAFPPPYKINDFGSYGGDELVPWFDNHHHHHRSDSTTAAVPISISASATMTMDALVPCANAHDDDGPRLVDGCSTGVGSCPGNDNSKFERQRVAARVETGAAHERSCRDHSVSGSATFGRDLSVRGLTSTSTGSPGNTSSGKNGGKSTTGDEHDSVYSHSRPQRDADDEEENKKKGKGKGKSSISTKRSRAAAIHNQSERKRRDKINQRMKTLQKMVPNSSKTDKASMLDEVIEYLKQLQAQVHVMSRVSPAMMMPLAMQQQLQMSMMNPMTMGMGMGMGMGMNVMDLNSLAAAGRTNIPGMPPVFHPSAFMPLGPWDGNGVVGDRIPPPTSLMTDPMSTFLACQQPQVTQRLASQPMMTMDAYSRMAAMFQQMHQQSQGHRSNKNQ